MNPKDEKDLLKTMQCIELLLFVITRCVALGLLLLVVNISK